MKLNLGRKVALIHHVIKKSNASLWVIPNEKLVKEEQLVRTSLKKKFTDQHIQWAQKTIINLVQLWKMTSIMKDITGFGKLKMKWISVRWTNENFSGKITKEICKQYKLNRHVDLSEAFPFHKFADTDNKYLRAMKQIKKLGSNQKNQSLSQTKKLINA